ncbi:MAG: hypothetical protein GXO83_13380 [Chlorobi bacterium]|nr:hypothetical protein [Chlorobiota bacterium]
MQKERNETMKILLANKENANAQIAHLQFAQADTQPKIAKELFLTPSY